MTQSVGSTVGAIYQAKGRTDWMFWWGISTGTVAAVCFMIGVRWGILGVAWAYFIASFIIFAYPSFAIPFRLIELKFIEFLSVLWRPFVCSMIMFFFLICIKYLIPSHIVPLLKLVILTGVGAVIHLVAARTFNKHQFNEIVQTVKAKA